MPDDPDQQAVAAARSGDFAAFESLVAKHERRVYRVAARIVGRRHDAEEVVQQTFLSVVEHLDEFRGESTFATWLMRIATNHALLLLRRRAARPTVPLADERFDEDAQGLPHPQFVAQWRNSPEEIASHRETRQILTEALDELDLKHSMVFVLRDLEGFSTQQTAEALSISPGNVKVRLLRARLMLRERLTRVFGDEAERVLSGHEH
ncbi:MAG: sigma-70 family RNA polymerase sigma factor [Planctomycetia bacterium]|nr:sigma-70 family RNA polymerase sigma factor [Planctomycetia bacterium]